MLQAGQIAQKLGHLSKRLHRRFDDSPQLAIIERATEQIAEQVDQLHGTARVRLAAPRPEEPEQDDPTPPPEVTPHEQRPPDEKQKEKEEQSEDKPEQEGEEGRKASSLQELDRDLQAAGEEPMLPPVGEPLPVQPRSKKALAEMDFEDLKDLAKTHGVQTYRTKRENIQKGLERKGITEG